MVAYVKQIPLRQHDIKCRTLSVSHLELTKTHTRIRPASERRGDIGYLLSQLAFRSQVAIIKD